MPPFIEEDLLRLRHLERLRYSFIDQASNMKRKIISLLDQVFPEYEQLFSDVYGKSSTEIVINDTLPEDFLHIDTNELANLLQEASNDRLGEYSAFKKANQIRERALNTFGITIGTDVFKLQIQLLLEQIQLIEKHLVEIEKVTIEIFNSQKYYLTTITDISDVTACVTLGEIDSIKQFERSEQHVAYASLDASVHQSGDFNS